MVMPASRVAPLHTNMEETVGSSEDKQFAYFSNAVFIPKGSSVLSVEVVKSLETAVASGNMVEVVSIVKEIVQKVPRTTMKIAVTGDSGNGMSSFINALRVIGHEEEDSAPTGVVRTTQKPACYSSSHFPDVELWDLPGLGATAQSVESYLDEMQISTYELIIIIASEQFSANHVKLAKAMQRMRKRFYVVWTKLDRDLSTSTIPEPQLLQNIQRNIQENLRKEEVKEPHLFLVSILKPESYDFPKLRETLQKDLSDIKYHGLLETLYQICERTINERVESIKKSIDTDRLQSDLEILDPNNSIECWKVFQKIFGVHDESLHQVALKIGKPDTYFTTSTESQDMQRYQQDGWTWGGLFHFGRGLVSTGFNHMQCCIYPPHRRYMQQKVVLDETAGKAKNVLLEILKDSIFHWKV
ncbi:immunity-related GTPase family M protein 1-like isoform X2 [Apodemus sylvaticus]|uniref:immunity-related GTPase family M protein 1-like isoform X2 n=1 Tax=Apodemus sylvaticus TaxID=10129 RepID=UPI002242708A|nr:immunity-related GTPase family M protein 1-like isoform X2 [Apodemus sylvaticus]XP_052053605.1 immunity-related GTPase family M protein 1-like isoform X2 [Apodemus sylvaticus]